MYDILNRYKEEEKIFVALVKTYNKNDKNEIEYFQRIFQSANINFLIGSGASKPAINILGTIEFDLQQHIINRDEVSYYNLSESFLRGVWDATDILLDRTYESSIYCFLTEFVNNVKTTQRNYIKFISILENILIKRRTGLLPRRANIFTTNYDLFIEDAATYRHNLILNDGFTHRKNIYNEYIYDSKSFYRSIYNTGNFYNYSVELPTINLIKLHGSLSWKKEGDDVYYKIPPIKPIRFEDSQNQKDWVNQHALVLPRKEKFKETVLENIYYDLLRTYSNELDKEGTLLIVFGFSFADEHIELLTKKALRNTTLKLMIFAYNESSTKSYNDKFKDFANVEIVYLKDEDMDLEKFCSILEII